MNQICTLRIGLRGPKKGSGKRSTTHRGCGWILGAWFTGSRREIERERERASVGFVYIFLAPRESVAP